MKILLVGLSRGSSLTVEMLASVVWKEPKFVCIERGVSTVIVQLPQDLPSYDLCMVDLLGIGYSRFTIEREMVLKKIVQSCPSLIFVPPGSGGGWLKSDILQNCRQNNATSCLTIQHPISTTVLRDEMKLMHRNLSSITTSKSVATFIPDKKQVQINQIDKQNLALNHKYVVQRDVADVLIGDSHYLNADIVRTNEITKPLQNKPQRLDGLDNLDVTQKVHFAPPFLLTEFNYAYLIAASPEVKNNPFLTLTYHCILESGPTELRISKKAATVFCPTENWVASSISKSLIARLLEQPMMVKLATVIEIDPAHLMQTALELNSNKVDSRKALDAEVWRLVFFALHEKPLYLQTSERFQLLRFPNFTRMRGMPDIFIQIAILCLRKPHSIKELQEILQDHPPQLIQLFFACALLSGMASVIRQPMSDVPYKISG